MLPRQKFLASRVTRGSIYPWTVSFIISRGKLGHEIIQDLQYLFFGGGIRIIVYDVRSDFINLRNHLFRERYSQNTGHFLYDTIKKLIKTIDEDQSVGRIWIVEGNILQNPIGIEQEISVH